MNYRKILHIDMDAFYASVEQRDHPELKGKPVVVGGSPGGRGVVAAASYEARKFGIKSAMPSFKVLKLCPHAVFIKPRFDAYKEVSIQIRNIFLEWADLVEPLSLDEAYLDVTENKKGEKSARNAAERIRKQIFEETGLTASAGVAVNKFLAKLASDINKPNGIAVITPEKMFKFLEELPVGKFHGIGRATEKKMHALGLFTGAELKALSEQELIKHFGKVGSFYYKIVRGEDDREVQPDRIRKSVGAENTFSKDLEDMPEIRENLSEIAEKVSQRMDRIEAKGRTITLKVRYENFDSVTRSQTLADEVSDVKTIFNTALQLLEFTDVPNRKVRLLGISVSNLNIARDESQSGHQLELPFEPYVAD